MKQQKEFSKKIFNIIVFIYIVVILFSMTLMWKTGTTDALAYLIPSITGLMATTIGFYYWKARLENKIKLMNDYKISYQDVEEISSDIDTDNNSEVG